MFNNSELMPMCEYNIVKDGAVSEELEDKAEAAADTCQPSSVPSGRSPRLCLDRWLHLQLEGSPRESTNAKELL